MTSNKMDFWVFFPSCHTGTYHLLWQYWIPDTQNDTINGTPIFTEAKDFTVCIPGAEKLFGLLEGLIPESGYINGLEHPTAADMVVFFIFHAYMPIGAFIKNAKFDLSKFPKGAPLANKTKEATGYASDFMTAGAFGV